MSELCNKGLWKLPSGHFGPKAGLSPIQFHWLVVPDTTSGRLANWLFLGPGHNVPSVKIKIAVGRGGQGTVIIFSGRRTDYWNRFRFEVHQSIINSCYEVVSQIEYINLDKKRTFYDINYFIFRKY